MKSLPFDETGNALRELESNGSDLSKPLEMDFFVAVPSQELGEKVALKIKALGFKVSVEQDDETKNWTCYCSITLVPEYYKVVNLENQLSLIAQPYGGYADGFGSYGNALKQ